MVANLLYALTSLPPLWLLLDSAQYVVICGGAGFVCSLPMTESFFLRVVQSSHPPPPRLVLPFTTLPGSNSTSGTYKHLLKDALKAS